MPRFRYRSLVVALVSALVTSALLNVVADSLHLNFYRPRAPRSNMNAYAYQQSGESADVLFLGTSRTQQGVNANLVGELLQQAGQPDVSVFNVAQPAAGVVTNQIMLRDLIRSNGCPEVIVLEVSPGSLNQNGSWWPTVADYAALRDAPVVLPGVTSFERLDFALASMLRGGTRLFDRLVEPPESQSTARILTTRGSRYGALTWRPPPGERGPGERVARMARNLYRRKFWRRMDIGGGTTRALRRSAALAESCSAQLVLVRMPTLLEFSPEDHERVNLPFVHTIDRFLASHDALFVDADSIEVELPRDHYRDPVHLNLGGSIVFGEYLARDVLLPLLGSEN